MGSFREEFMRTERALARHPAAIKERLIDAAIAGVAHLNANETELAKMPEELRQEFLGFMDELTKAGGSPVPGEGSIHGTAIFAILKRFPRDHSTIRQCLVTENLKSQA